MKPEHNLLDDTIMPAGHRDAILSAGSRVLRRRRQKQIAGQFLAIAIFAVAAIFFLDKRPTVTTTAPIVAATAVHSQPGAHGVNTLSDDQLLALFPKTPVGIAKLSNGQKVLIFTRPGDAKRFITHL